jgi:hypothetical protein
MRIAHLDSMGKLDKAKTQLVAADSVKRLVTLQFLPCSWFADAEIYMH